MNLTASKKLVLFLHFPLIFPNLVEHPALKNHWAVISNFIAITKVLLQSVIKEDDLNFSSCINNYT